MPADNQPKVSILMAYYNNLEYIQESIQSVYNQTYTNWELIVVNDCSPDPAANELIAALQKKFGFTLIHLEKNSGASKAFHTAFEHSSGDYISLISHDDMYTSDKIEYSMQRLLAANLDALYCNGILLDSDGKQKPFSTTAVLEKQTLGQQHVAALISSSDSVACLLTQGAVYSRKIFSELAWIKEKFLLDDWPFTIEVWRNYKTEFDPRPVYLYRFHENNVHKDYWKWFPARIQVVSELIEEDQKLEVLSFLLTNIGEFSLQNGRNEEAFRLAAAGLSLAQTEKNTVYASKVITKSKPKKPLIKQFKNSSRVIVSGQKKSYKIYRKVVRHILESPPFNKNRK